MPGAGKTTREAEKKRSTGETEVRVRLGLDSPRAPSVATGLPFFDHMLCQLGKHGGFGLEIEARGDLAVDAHHTVEDVGITLGEAFSDCLGDKKGIRRFAATAIPLDEALTEVALDLSGRPYLRYDVETDAEWSPIGSPGFEPQLAEEFWRAFAGSAQMTLHISLRYGKNPHHVLESSFKAVARALRDATRLEGEGVPSTKGLL